MANRSNADSPPGSLRRTSNLSVAALILSASAFFLSMIAVLTASGVMGNSTASSYFARQVKAYIESNPEVIAAALNQAASSPQVAEANELTTVINQHHFEDPASPVAGNVSGDVTVVEFFDYNCPYCRKAGPILDALQRSDSQVKFVFKEFPILGPGSVYAARAALAAQKQGLGLSHRYALPSFFRAVHFALSVKKKKSAEDKRLLSELKVPAPDLGDDTETGIINPIEGVMIGSLYTAIAHYMLITETLPADADVHIMTDPDGSFVAAVPVVLKESDQE